MIQKNDPLQGLSLADPSSAVFLVSIVLKIYLIYGVYHVHALISDFFRNQHTMIICWWFCGMSLPFSRIINFHSFCSCCTLQIYILGEVCLHTFYHLYRDLAATHNSSFRLFIIPSRNISFYPR